MGSKQSQTIGKVLAPAVKLWLRSQVEAVEGLDVKIEAGDRQLLGGTIRRVSLQACKAVYRGLHLSKIQLEASKIRTNLPQVIRGKPFQLLEPVPVIGELQLKEADLNASLKTGSLLVDGLTDLLCQLLTAGGAIASAQILKNSAPSWQHIGMESDRLTIRGSLPTAEENPFALRGETPIIISSHLQLASSNQLRLSSLDIQTSADLNLGIADSFPVELGSDVEIKDLIIARQKLVIRGIINVRS